MALRKPPHWMCLCYRIIHQLQKLEIQNLENGLPLSAYGLRRRCDRLLDQIHSVITWCLAYPDFISFGADKSRRNLFDIFRVQDTIVNKPPKIKMTVTPANSYPSERLIIYAVLARSDYISPRWRNGNEWFKSYSICNLTLLGWPNFNIISPYFSLRIFVGILNDIEKSWFVNKIWVVNFHLIKNFTVCCFYWLYQYLCVS